MEMELKIAFEVYKEELFGEAAPYKYLSDESALGYLSGSCYLFAESLDFSVALEDKFLLVDGSMYLQSSRSLHFLELFFVFGCVESSKVFELYLSPEMYKEKQQTASVEMDPTAISNGQEQSVRKLAVLTGEIKNSRQDERVHEPAIPEIQFKFLLRSGLALEAKVVRLREEMYLIDAGVGRPRIATQEELIKPPETTGPARLTNRVGFLNPSNRESPVKNLVLQRCFVDLVTGDSRIKQQAAARFDDMVGQTEAGGGGEQPLLLPRRFRKHRAWMELKNKWRANAKVKGFVAEKVRGGYSIAIAGYLAFLPSRQAYNRRITSDRFMIESVTPKNIVVARAG
ncbi:UNVERIFIED_CONTAM: Ribosomal protein S1, mitochondrial [Sesamum calycinum]|uniref:Ribosomal protein S1, mitochondrial n=1 Tax=Sesamum calycinum TaxID=2727403 RepID=A0AAW2SZC6_9LAMI